MNEDVVRELTLLRELGFTHLDLSVGGWQLAVGSGAVATAPAVASETAEANEPLFVSSTANRQPPT
ncbi:MAG TPA: hypothetical protein VF608_05535, partial [Thermoanaerobaculia bacterium]